VSRWSVGGESVSRWSVRGASWRQQALLWKDILLFARVLKRRLTGEDARATLGKRGEMPSI